MTIDPNREALQDKLLHCDGRDCTCHAYGSSECACDADWTPAQVYKLQSELATLRALVEEINLHCITADGWEDGETFYKGTVESIRDVLANAKQPGR